jgi:hypothetical protein
MRARRRSIFARARDTVPVVAVAGIGIVGVFLAMNVLVTAAPVALDLSPSPSNGGSPSPPVSPSALPVATNTPPVTPAPTASLPDYKPTLVSSDVSATDPNGVWDVYLRYPAFVEGTTSWADAIDASILGELQTRAAQWEEGPAAYRQVAGKVNTLYGSFTTELLTPALASFTLTWDDNSSPSGPVTNVETLNFDLGTGQRIAFDDLFTDPAAALAVVSGEALSLLQVELGANYSPTIAIEGTSPSPANYVNWALTKDGIKITFDPYQVSSSGTALPTVVVPWDSLLPVMVTTGPVANLAGL